ncbi:MAG: acetyltransferase [Candidatus Synechococcus spongiarum 15L]|uniref:N-acetyltransferase n=3 Tax=Candidatus Synechococcus spongiarum TaxID=431041 RepID=A0A1T1CE05_9SYNE|nr:GNAT family N-acetyltransferase [Candidatus Synechococcus spongiarum]KKZ11313.1 MAG: acetyltransferase [Candidatus Synechococcus spongiarum 15L]OOV26830.1 N-acetyltransferase [Candidatus Synechococcus spongiarum LMB bulk15M]OOV36149.1 N-acetyltransferase [Candidatus Synechococcus spongiarum LMB bulk15N]OOV36829.1 N-acetyltransferase [Candidatus Synechococcus spongiarum LMB bulk10D]
MVRIRPLLPEDWPATWHVMKPVVRAGETLPFDPSMDAEAGYAIWVEAALQAFVAVAADGRVLGTYHIKPNGPTLAAHVCNCGYVVAATARRQGIGSLMFSHSRDQALALGFRAMQFNLVVSTNTAAVQAWQRNGMAVVGTLPGAFRHQRLGFVDAHVMFKVLKGD